MGPPAPAIGRYHFSGVLFEGNTRLTVSGELLITADTLVMEVPGATCRQHESDADRVEVFCVTTEVNVATRQRAGFRFAWHPAEPARDARVAVITRVDGRQRHCPPEPPLSDCYMEALAISTSRQVPLTLTPAEPAHPPLHARIHHPVGNPPGAPKAGTPGVELMTPRRRAYLTLWPAPQEHPCRSLPASPESSTTLSATRLPTSS